MAGSMVVTSRHTGLPLPAAGAVPAQNSMMTSCSMPPRLTSSADVQPDAEPPAAVPPDVPGCSHARTRCSLMHVRLHRCTPQAAPIQQLLLPQGGAALHASAAAAA